MVSVSVGRMAFDVVFWFVVRAWSLNKGGINKRRKRERVKRVSRCQKKREEMESRSNREGDLNACDTKKQRER